MPSAGMFWHDRLHALLLWVMLLLRCKALMWTQILQRIAVQALVVRDDTPLGFSRAERLPGFPTSTIICRSGRSSNTLTGSSPRMFTSAGCIVSVPGRANVAFPSTVASATRRLMLERQEYLKHPTQYSIALSQRKCLPWQNFPYDQAGPLEHMDGKRNPRAWYV